MLKPKQVI